MTIDVFDYSALLDGILPIIFKKISYEVVTTLPSNKLLKNEDLGKFILLNTNGTFTTYFIWKNSNNKPELFRLTSSGSGGVSVIEVSSIPSNVSNYDIGTILITSSGSAGIVYESNGVKKIVNLSSSGGGDVSLDPISYSEMLELWNGGA